MPALVRRRAQLFSYDAYGKPLSERWSKELAYFAQTQIQPNLNDREFAAFLADLQTTLRTIDLMVEHASKEQPALLSFADDMTPNQFESFCAAELRQAGWHARVTLQSRDQGVDVVAEKNGIRVVIQSKLYKRPVGNKAVQEIAAGRAHEQADYGIVVTNHRYTQDAEQLASTNGVLLLHYSDLMHLDSILRPGRTKAEDWFYFSDDTDEVGPVALGDLKQQLSVLPRRATVYVWKQGFEEWKLARDVPELKT